MDKRAEVDRTPDEFFALTYPTYNFRDLAKDGVHRFLCKNDKTIRQWELTYGGGKTHTRITLLHLVRDPANLPDLPAVHEFIEPVAMSPPETRVAALIVAARVDAESHPDAPRRPREGLHRPDRRLSGIYAALNVPEFWRVRRGLVSIEQLVTPGTYIAAEKSQFLPVRPEDVSRWIWDEEEPGRPGWKRLLRDRARDELV